MFGKEFKIVLLLLLLTLTSCNMQKKPNYDDISGTYIFRYPSNEVEVLVLSNDLTFTRNIYKNERDYLSKDSVLHLNTGFWELSDFDKTLNFENWLLYCRNSNPNEVSLNPTRGFLGGASWLPSNIIRKTDLIVISTDFSYVFEKL